MTKPFNRRDFIKTSGTATTLLAISSPLYFLNSCKSAINSNDLFQLFQIPPSQAKPFYRWLWNGNRLTTKEVAREPYCLQRMGSGRLELSWFRIKQYLR